MAHTIECALNYGLYAKWLSNLSSVCLEGHRGCTCWRRWGISRWIWRRTLRISGSVAREGAELRVASWSVYSLCVCRYVCVYVGVFVYRERCAGVNVCGGGARSCAWPLELCIACVCVDIYLYMYVYLYMCECGCGCGCVWAARGLMGCVFIYVCRCMYICV